MFLLSALNWRDWLLVTAFPGVNDLKSNTAEFVSWASDQEPIASEFDNMGTQQSALLHIPPLKGLGLMAQSYSSSRRFCINRAVTQPHLFSQRVQLRHLVYCLCSAESRRSLKLQEWQKHDSSQEGRNLLQRFSCKVFLFMFHRISVPVVVRHYSVTLSPPAFH